MLEEKVEEKAFATTGQRLSHILDKAGFRQGHGRVKELVSFLDSSLAGIRYTTVRSWFHDHAPPLAKIESILRELNKAYPLNVDLQLVATWWKAGGHYPFGSELEAKPSTRSTNDMNAQPHTHDESVDSLFVGQVYLLVYQKASEMNIDVNNDIDRDVLKGIFDKILNHCKDNDISVESEELNKVITSLLHLAKEGLM